MPDKPATVAAYAAAASLAAVTFFYVIAPNYLLDENSRDADYSHDEAGLFARGRSKHTIVGLVNDANDCFMNSTLQALAPLHDLRLYLIRELHRREHDGRELYETLIVPDEADSATTTTTTLDRNKRGEIAARTLSLQRAPVTRALKQMLDALNERPIYRKTTTIEPFVTALERAFRAGINRSQQDAQEFLQIVLERVWEEFKAGERVRREAARRRGLTSQKDVKPTSSPNGHGNGIASTTSASTDPSSPSSTSTSSDPCLYEPEPPAAIPFPFLGKLSSQVECRACGYQPRPKPTSFVNLTLQIPQHKGSATLGSCLDTLLMTEYIDDYRCDRCALVHALEERQRAIQQCRVKSTQQAHIEKEIDAIQHALNTDPESTPPDISLSSAPLRQIARTTRIVSYPRILAIHLSRSIYGAGYASSTKNATKVSFPDLLTLGRTLLSRDAEKKYRLVSIVCHKGNSHNSGHYESIRRCVVREPKSTEVNEEVWRWVGSKSRERERSGGEAGEAGDGNGNAQVEVEGDGDHSGGSDSAVPVADNGNGNSNGSSSSNPAAASTASPSRATSSSATSRSHAETETTTSIAPSVSPETENENAKDDNKPSQSQSQPQSQPAQSQEQQQPPTKPSAVEHANYPPTNDAHIHPSDDFIDESSLHRTTTRLLNRVSRSTNASHTPGTGTGTGARSSKSRDRREKKARKEKQRQKQRQRLSDKWFRVSDEKVKQCKTSDVLGMQKEVYLLFYELEDEK